MLTDLFMDLQSLLRPILWGLSTFLKQHEQIGRAGMMFYFIILLLMKYTVRLAIPDFFMKQHLMIRAAHILLQRRHQIILLWHIIIPTVYRLRCQTAQIITGLISSLKNLSL